MLAAIGISFFQWSFTAGLPPSKPPISAVAKEFFTNVFFHPAKNMIAILFMGAIVIGAVVGIIFLIKKIYEKCTEEAIAP